MKNLFLIIGITSFSMMIIVAACTNTSTKEDKPVVAISNAELIKRGEYLVNAVGCDDCHSPKKMGPVEPEIIPELRFSGYPSSRPLQNADSNVVKQGWGLVGSDFTYWVGPWGMSFSANITSDATGIGNWTEEQFFKALREGKYKGLDNSRPLLPPMPWFVYKNFNDDDIRAIFAFLKSTKPVENVVPAPVGFAGLKK